jgi:hypothetical protein
MLPLYLLVIAYGVWYFVFKRQIFDFVSAAFFGQILYFMPGAYGLVFNPYLPDFDPVEPIIWQTYAVWVVAMVSTIITGKLYTPTPNSFNELRTSFSFDLASVVSLIIFFLLALNYGGDALFSPDKNDVLEAQGRLFIVYSVITTVSFAIFFVQKKFLLFVVPALSMCFLVYIGYRSEVATAFVAILVYFARKNGVRTYLRPAYLLPTLAFGFLIFAYKSVYIAIKMGRMDLVITSITSDNFISDTIFRSEPFITQSILNEILARDYSVPASDLFYSLIAAVPGLSEVIGQGASRLGFSFQEQLFPNLTYGIASNIYGHFYAALGVFGLALFMAIYNLSLVLVSKGLSGRLSEVRVAALIIGSFLAFYINRNDLANTLTIVNRVLYVMVGLAVLSVVFKIFEPEPGNRTRLPA